MRRPAGVVRPSGYGVGVGAAESLPEGDGLGCVVPEALLLSLGDGDADELESVVGLALALPVGRALPSGEGVDDTPAVALAEAVGLASTRSGSTIAMI